MIGSSHYKFSLFQLYHNWKGINYGLILYYLVLSCTIWNSRKCIEAFFYIQVELGSQISRDCNLTSGETKPLFYRMEEGLSILQRRNRDPIILNSLDKCNDSSFLSLLCLHHPYQSAFFQLYLFRLSFLSPIWLVVAGAFIRIRNLELQQQDETKKLQRPFLEQ